jgi:Rhomboid family
MRKRESRGSDYRIMRSAGALFGPTIEDRLGHGRYLAFYIGCGLAASIAHVLFNPTSIVPALGAWPPVVSSRASAWIPSNALPERGAAFPSLERVQMVDPKPRYVRPRRM